MTTPAYKMFAPLLFICGLFAALASVASAQKYEVKATTARNVEFGKFHTYAWTSGRPSADPNINSRITQAIDRELTGVGLTRATAPDAPDVLVTYHSVSRTDVDVNAKPNATGARPEQMVGSLAVALLAPADRKELLRLRIDKPIDTSNLDASINDVVKELFTKYPTRTGKK